MAGDTMSLLTQALLLGVAGGIVGTIFMNLTWEFVNKEETINELDIEEMIELQKQYRQVPEHIRYDFRNN